MNGRQADDDKDESDDVAVVVGTWKRVLLLGDSEDIAFAIGGQVSSIVKFAVLPTNVHRRMKTSQQLSCRV